MKILLVNKAYYPHLGGVETVVRQIAEGMLKRGHETTVLCFGERDVTETIAGVEVHRIRPIGRIGSAPVKFRFVTEFSKLSKRVDVINFHSPNPMGEISFLLCPSARKKGVKIVCTYQGDAQKPRFLLPIYDFILKRFFRLCDVIAVSNPPLSENSRVLKTGSNKDKLLIIPLGVRAENYSKHLPSDIDEARRLLTHLPSSSFKVMYAGRMVYYKGLEVLLKAMKAMKEKGLPVSAFLVGSGPEEYDIKNFIINNAMEKEILILPHQPEGVYRALFSLADCFVLPSTHQTEAFGIVLTEAMASGLPIISTELGTGTSWINRDGETGIVVPPRNPNALAEAVAYLANHEVERKAMATKSLANARRFFEEEMMLDAYDEVFRTITNLPHLCS